MTIALRDSFLNSSLQEPQIKNTKTEMNEEILSFFFSFLEDTTRNSTKIKKERQGAAWVFNKMCILF